MNIPSREGGTTIASSKSSNELSCIASACAFCVNCIAHPTGTSGRNKSTVLHRYTGNVEIIMESLCAYFRVTFLLARDKDRKLSRD